MPQAIVRDGLKKGDAVVVTGAAQGLGRGIALRLSEEGAKLALWDVQGDSVEETAALCRDAGAADAMTCIVDVGDEASVRAGADAVLSVQVNVDGIDSRPWQSFSGYRIEPLYIKVRSAEWINEHCNCRFLGGARWDGPDCPK